MVSSIFVLVGAVIAYGVYSYVAGLQRNIAEAKKVGLPYVVTRTWKQKVPKAAQATD